MKRNSKISNFLRPLSECPLQAFLSDVVQVADILEWVLDQVGVADVWQTSFSISEEFLRRLYFISKHNKVASINLILDLKATNKTLKLWSFIDSVITNAYLADNHSKLLLIRGGSSKVSVITSQNLTRGNRLESTVITTSPQVFDSLFVKVKDVMNNSISLHEVLRERITAD